MKKWYEILKIQRRYYSEKILDRAGSVSLETFHRYQSLTLLQSQMFFCDCNYVCYNGCASKVIGSNYSSSMPKLLIFSDASTLTHDTSPICCKRENGEVSALQNSQTLRLRLSHCFKSKKMSYHYNFINALKTGRSGSASWQDVFTNNSKCFDTKLRKVISRVFQWAGNKQFFQLYSECLNKITICFACEIQRMNFTKEYSYETYAMNVYAFSWLK